MPYIDQPLCQYWLDMANHLQKQLPEEGAEYYLFTLTADSAGIVSRWSFSQFVGFTPNTPHFELRKPDVINPTVAGTNLQKCGEPALIINSATDLLAFLRLGGHGIIRHSVLEEYFPEWLEAKAFAPLGAKLGFVAASSVPHSKFVKRPRLKTKKRVRTRDGNMCRICEKGTSEGALLTLHHVTPRKFAGFTEEENLITVCRECHDKIGETIRSDFYQLIGISRFDLSATNRDYLEGVKRYRKNRFDQLMASSER